jgi:DNA-binding response OmpR family regulator
VALTYEIEVLGRLTGFVFPMSYRRFSKDPSSTGTPEVAVVAEKAEVTMAVRARVLLVEDEDDIRELINYSLAQAGLEVEEASDGAEALEKLRAFAPDLVILDLMLPGMTGLEVCQRLRSRADTAQLPIMVVSAKSNPSDKALGLAMGADDYVTKPFSPRDLLLRAIALLAVR